jgi:mannitol-1-/sugar-/sorbitol-6-/2-deoxyglucose-6-phosphatase
MALNTVIFDMDGVLIDSEPYWQEAGKEVLNKFGIVLTEQQYHSTTGLRTREWINWWFEQFGVDKKYAQEAGDTIVELAIKKIHDEAPVMPGVGYIFPFFKERNFKIGLATSSPVALINVVAEKLNIRKYLLGISSAEELVHSKPHPEVYLNCAHTLGVSPLDCICFEDSFNGMLAAKSARMKCVIIPAEIQRVDKRWGAADLQLDSLEQFDDAALEAVES